MWKYKGYLIDLDGTMYRGDERIKGAKTFIDFLTEESLPYLFITNNSSATQTEVAAKLNQMGIQAVKDQVVTSAIATARYIRRKKPHARVFMIGEEGLKDALIQAGCNLVTDHADYVVCGIDREISYEKLATACQLIRKGATFISTNQDAAIPTEKGLLPGNGALTASITYSTGTAPLFIGKPEKWIMEEALELIGLKREDVIMIGDNYETDISAGINTRMDTLMVLTGFSTKEDLREVRKQPTYVADNLIKWMEDGAHLHSEQAK